MNKPRLLLDVDGVLANFDEALFDVLVEIGGPRYTAHDMKGWFIEDQIDEAFRPELRRRMRLPGFCSGLEPYPGVVEAVTRLNTVADVYFVTAAMYDAPFWMWEREQWLVRTFDVHARQILFAHAKFLVQGDVFVDDRPKNAELWHHHFPLGKAFLWDQPYNSRTTSGTGVVKTLDWDEVYRACRFP